MDIPEGPPKDAEGKPIADTKAGLYQKYHVTRTDGSSAPGGKHEKCRYFVLDLVHDEEYARAAIDAYIKACQTKYPALAGDLEHIFCFNIPLVDGHTHKEKLP